MDETRPIYDESIERFIFFFGQNKQTKFLFYYIEQTKLITLSS